MTAVGLEEVTPTVAVGIGWGGCSMVSTLHDMVKEEGISEKFRFVGIDTNPKDLRTNIDYEETGVTKFELQAPEQWDENRHDYDFLHPQLLPGGEMQLEKTGALRKRRIGRYYVDSHRNFDDLRTHLRGVVEEFADIHDDYIDREGQRMNIWVMNSLGGGTGSGSFPIISTILKEITRNSVWSPGDFFICGLGALPNTDDISEDNINYHLNSYAALRDIQVLINEDDDVNRELHLGEERSGVEHDDRYELPGYIFDRYFLQPFDQTEISSDAYAYQLNKASASVPLYFSLVSEQDNWPDGITEYTNDRLYAFDTYELSVPVEDIFRYFGTKERITELESELSDLNAHKDRVTNDLDVIDDVSRVDIENYIQEYVESQDQVEDARLTEVVPEHVQLPERVGFDMVETAKSAVGGMDLTVDSVDDTVEERYNDEWDNTETDQSDHRNIFKYVFYQMVVRKTSEEKEDHKIHELVESTWNKYKEKLMAEYQWLDGSDAPKKWQDGLSKFLEEEKERREEELPTGALFGSGFFLILSVLLLSTLLLNIGPIQTLAETNPIAAVPLSLASLMVGLLLLIALGLFLVYIVPYLRLSSLKGTIEESERAYNEYLELENVSKAMNDRLSELNFGEQELEQQKTDLEHQISQKETLLSNQRSVQETVIERLNEWKFEFDRHLALPIRDTDQLEESHIKNKIREYIGDHQSIKLDVVNQELFDVDVEIDIQEEDESGDQYEMSIPESIKWFMDRELIAKADVSQALNEILGEEERLARCPLRHYSNKDPDIDKILQYIWNPMNESIQDAEGGGQSYDMITGDYDTEQKNGEIADEFRVWLMGAYTNFYLENSAPYIDIDSLYTGVGDGDQNVAEEFDIPADEEPNFVTRRFAYPEFYGNHNHPISDDVDKYPK